MRINTRKLFKILLLTSCFLLFCFLKDPSRKVEAESDKSKRFPLYKEANVEEWLEAQVKPEETYAIRFNATSKVESLEVYIQKASVLMSSMRLTVYEWDTDYSTSISKEPVFDKVEERFSRESWLSFEFPEEKMLQGEYLLVLDDLKGSLVLHQSTTSHKDVLMYHMGSEIQGNIRARVKSSTESENILAQLSELSSKEPSFIVQPDTWVATDGLGRELPNSSAEGGVRKDKFVGLFYWTWHTILSKPGTFRNVTEVLKDHPNIGGDYQSPHWQGASNFFWNEPIYGYYDGFDPWVFRKQAELLADAGVDVVIFDNTNKDRTHLDGAYILLETFAKARRDGVKTPQIAFMLPFTSEQYTLCQLDEIYNSIYAQGKYKDLWFYWKGKPLILCAKSVLDAADEKQKEYLDFFTMRQVQPSYTEGQTMQDMWGWLSVYPQQVYYNKDKTPEQITIGVAQNHNKKDGLTAMNGENVFGRTYSVRLDGYDTRENAVQYGANFAEQIEYALEVDPEFVFITGWNEWRAGRYEEWKNVVNAFPDTYNDEFSRDIEPTKGDLKDHYYYQMVSFIRKFKGAKSVPAGIKKEIDIYSDIAQWNSVVPYYASYPNNTKDRDGGGYGGLSYENTTGRNDIIGSKVTYDDDNIYFMVETAQDLTSHTDKAWMRLLIGLPNYSKESSWESFSYIVNRVSPTENKAVLEKSLGGWNWEKVRDVDFSVIGNTLQVKIPRSLIDITEKDFTVYFKWSDNMQTEGDIMDFYVNGDVAPGGRFKFVFNTTDVVKKQPVNKLLGVIVGSIAVALGIIGFGVYAKRIKARKKGKGL